MIRGFYGNVWDVRSSSWEPGEPEQGAINKINSRSRGSSAAAEERVKWCFLLTRNSGIDGEWTRTERERDEAWNDSLECDVSCSSSVGTFKYFNASQRFQAMNDVPSHPIHNMINLFIRLFLCKVSHWDSLPESSDLVNDWMFLRTWMASGDLSIFRHHRICWVAEEEAENHRCRVNRWD